MRIKDRLSPYPILDNFGDDYIDSSFTVEYEVQTQFTEVTGRLFFRLKNKEIEQLIQDDLAEYTVHIECPTTCYREVITSKDSEIVFTLDASRLSRVIEIRTFIVLTGDVSKFTSAKFHPDYCGRSFDLSKHQIVAIGTAKDYHIRKDELDLDALPSIIQIKRMHDKRKGSLSVNTDNDDHIIIGLTEDIYDLYAGLGRSTFKESMFGLVLFPALIVILQRMCLNKDDDAVNTMHWFKVIKTMLSNNGIALEGLSIENDSLLSVCQSIFADPVARSFKELESVGEGM